MSSRGRPSSPPFALTSSRQISSAARICLPLGATAPVSAMLKPTLTGSAARAGAAIAETTMAQTASKKARRARIHPEIIPSSRWCLPHPSALANFRQRRGREDIALALAKECFADHRRDADQCEEGEEEQHEQRDGNALGDLRDVGKAERPGDQRNDQADDREFQHGDLPASRGRAERSDRVGPALSIRIDALALIYPSRHGAAGLHAAWDCRPKV